MVIVLVCLMMIIYVPINSLYSRDLMFFVTQTSTSHYWRYRTALLTLYAIHIQSINAANTDGSWNREKKLHNLPAQHFTFWH